MKQSIYQILISALLLMLTSTAISQTTTKTDYYFNDKSGNTFLISDFDKLPIPLDTTFFRQHLIGSSFHPGSSDSFFYSIKNIKVIRKKKEFELTVFSNPKTINIETILKNSGYVHYRLRIEKGQNGFQKVIIDFLFLEI